MKLFASDVSLLDEYFGRYGINETSLFFLKNGVKIVQIRATNKSLMIFRDNISPKDGFILGEQLYKLKVSKVYVAHTKRVKGFGDFLAAASNDLSLTVKKQKIVWLGKSFKIDKIVKILLREEIIKDRTKNKLLLSIKHLHCLQTLERTNMTTKNHFTLQVKIAADPKQNIFHLLGYIHSNSTVLFLDTLLQPRWNESFLKYVMKEMYINNAIIITTRQLDLIYRGDFTFVQRSFKECYSY